MNRRPVGPFVINGASQQVDGLVFWLPLMDVYPVDRMVHRLPSMTGSPFLDYDTDRASWKFSGTTQYFSLAEAVITASPLTIAAWVKPNSVASTRHICSICASANTTNFFNLRVLSTGPSISCQTGDGATSTATSSATVAVGTWYHACAVFGGTTARAAFTNGGAKGTQATARTPTGINQTNVGVLGGSSFTIPLNGWISDLRIYNRALTDAEVLALYLPQSRWDLYAEYRKVWAVASGPTLLNVAGTLSPAGATLKQPSKVLSGTLSSAGANLKTPLKVLAGAAAPSGALLKQPQRLLNGALTTGSALLKTPSKVYAGAINPSGDLLRTVNKLLTGTLTTTGDLLKNINKGMDGTLNPTGALNIFRIVLLAIAGALSFSGAVLKTPSKVINGLLATTGDLLKQPQKRLEGLVDLTGALSTAKGLVVLMLAGALSFAGTLNKTPAKLLTGSVSAIGSVSKQVARLLTGALSFSGAANLTKTVFLFLVGALTPMGAILKSATKRLSGQVNPAGALSKTVSKSMAGVLSFSGALLTGASGVVVFVASQFKGMFRGLFKRMR